LDFANNSISIIRSWFSLRLTLQRLKFLNVVIFNMEYALNVGLRNNVGHS